MVNSYAIIREILKVEEMSIAEKLVGAVFSLHLNRDKGQISVRQSVIAKECGLTERCVRGAVAKMVDAGIFEKVRGQTCLVLIPNVEIFEKKSVADGEKSSANRERKDAFLESWEWKMVRYKVLKDRCARCSFCGRTPKDGVRVFVEHIQPRFKYPELALDEKNLRIVCNQCKEAARLDGEE